MNDIRKRLNKDWIFFDGGAGTLLQAMGLKGGELPESWNISNPEKIMKLYRGYLDAGVNCITTNTFGANRLKYPENLEDVVRSAVELARKAREEAGREDAFIALDLGPTGKLLKPLGDLEFEDAVSLFGEVTRIGAEEGADLIIVETMSDSYELKAAVLGAKENADLPVFATVTFDAKGKLLTGGTVKSTVALLEGLRVDALGTNCSLGPKEMLPLVREFVEEASIPVIVTPNAGLPRNEDGKTVYDVSPEEFSDLMKGIADMGVQVLGGCCGTTPEHIRMTIEKCKDLPFKPASEKERTYVTSFAQAVEIGGIPKIIGERINPTGKKKLKEALKTEDMSYILGEGIKQEDAGAHILDVNVGMPEIDEPAMMERAVRELQGITALPLQLDTANPAALEKVLRLYNGKALVNSVTGKEESLNAVLPLVAKYGGVVVGLTLDEEGIPETVEGRVAIARKIYAAAEKYGIPKKDVVIDGLTLTISSDPDAAKVTLGTVKAITEELGGHTILGVSNVSFGLPMRELVNSNFFAMALMNGLSLAIINPGNKAMMDAYRSSLALLGFDENCGGFIERYAEAERLKKEARNVTAAIQVDGAGTPESAFAGRSGTSSENGCGEAFDGSMEAPATENLGRMAKKDQLPQGDCQKNQVLPKNDGESVGAVGKFRGELVESVKRGMEERAKVAAMAALQSRNPLEIINEDLIPALDEVGKGFEGGTIFLPQLLMSAEAAKAAFEVVKQAMPERNQEKKGKVIVATVKGDIHDIGKNIVKVLLDNYGFQVLDLGKDVAPEKIVEAAIEKEISLVGLSALMTTTVVSMHETVELLREKCPGVKVLVSGAVLNKEYADMIGADHYAKDAMATVRYAEEWAK